MKAKKLLTSLLITTMALAPAASFAQDEPEPEYDPVLTTIEGIGMTLTYGIILGLLAGVAIGAGVSTTLGVPILLTINQNEVSILQSYIGDHEHQLAQDISLGGGETVNDLAQLFGVPTNKRAQFAQALRRERRALMLAQDPTREQVERFGLLVLKIKYELDGIEVAIAQ